MWLPHWLCIWECCACARLKGSLVASLGGVLLEPPQPWAVFLQSPFVSGVFVWAPRISLICFTGSLLF